jgi:AraC family transcriptional regulator of adaptative response/methylated-DNA-[protein]-cysteine methyltransferase
MIAQDQTNYSRIAEAIGYIKDNFKSQPGLEEIAGKVAFSPFHFQRLFTDWEGVGPKKFLQYLTLEYAKKMLKDNQVSLFDTAIETGLSGPGRLHDLFINIEGMTPGEYKNGASTSKGICHMAFADDQEGSTPHLPRS